MRLIDKDLVLKTAKDKEWGLWCEIANIKFAPEVDAIPVEWFKNLIKTVEDSKNYEESEILKWALNRWENQEKENEVN